MRPPSLALPDVAPPLPGTSANAPGDRRPSPRRWLSQAMALAGLCLALHTGAQAAPSKAPSPARPPTEPSAALISIGMVNAQSGPSAGLGLALRQGVEAVLAEVNAQGGVHGQRLALAVVDDGYEPGDTVLGVLEAVQEHGARVLVGFTGAPSARAALPVLRDLQVPGVGAVTGAEVVRRPQDRQLFNLRASHEREAEVLVQRLSDQLVRRVGVVYQNDSFGKSVLDSLRAALGRRDMNLVALGQFQRNSMAVNTAVQTMLEASPEAVVIAAPYNQLIELAWRLRGGGLDVPLATVSAAGSDLLVQNPIQELDGLIISQVMPNPLDEEAPLAGHCRRALAAAGVFELHYLLFEGCAQAVTVVEALRRAGPNPDGPRIEQALRSMLGQDMGGLLLNNGRPDANAPVFLTELREGKLWPLATTERTKSAAR